MTTTVPMSRRTRRVSRCHTSTTRDDFEYGAAPPAAARPRARPPTPAAGGPGSDSLLLAKQR